MPISALRAAERKTLTDGSISKEEAQALAKLAKEKGADPAEVKQLLERDAFAPGARAALEKVLPKAPREASMFAGTRVGTNRYGEEVRVKKELGALGGYDNRLQAIAVARLAGAEPAAVIQGYDSKWHAVETTANFYGGGTDADGPTLAVWGLPSGATIDGLEAQLGLVNQELAGLDTKNPRRAELLDQRGELRAQMAKVVFGVDDDELRWVPNAVGRVADKVNIDLALSGPNDDLGHHGPANGATDVLDPKTPTAIEVSPKVLDSAAMSGSVLFHEVSHLEDFNLTREWISKYESQGHLFVRSQPKAFETWLTTQPLSPAQRELIGSTAAGATAATEGRAYVHAFLAAIDVGNAAGAALQLTTYAKQVGKRIPDFPRGSQVEKQLRAELKTAWASMTAEQRAVFKSAITAAKAENKGAWIATLELT